MIRLVWGPGFAGPHFLWMTASAQRQDEREASYEARPRDWVGRATQVAIDFPSTVFGASPTKSQQDRRSRSRQRTDGGVEILS